MVMLQDYYLQAKGGDPTYKYVLHFYAHEKNHQWNKTTKNSEEFLAT